MFNGDAKEPDIGNAQLVRDQIRERLAKFQFPSAELDRRLPNACNTEQSLIRRIFNDLKCGATEEGFPFDEPKKCMCIEQYAHLFHVLVLAKVLKRHVEVISGFDETTRATELRLGFLWSHRN